MKGSILKGNDYVVGIVIYVGKDVKGAIKYEETKPGLIMQALDANVVAMVVIIMLMAVILSAMRILWLVAHSGTLEYMHRRETSNTELVYEGIKAIINIDEIAVGTVNE